MDMTKLYNERTENILKAVNRENPAYVPVIGVPNCGALAYSGVTLWDVIDDEAAYHRVFTKVLEDIYMDGVLAQGIWALPNAPKVLPGIQTQIGPDGMTLQNHQSALMKPEDYPALIAECDSFISNTLVARRFPQLFTGDMKDAVKALESVVNDQLFFFMGNHNGALPQIAAEQYGIPTVLNGWYQIENPLDLIFDYFRGFRGTITDLRRHPDLIKEALDVLWEQKCEHFNQLDTAFPFCPQYPHIPAYINAKQFEKFYWPYEKMLIENIYRAGSKAYIQLQGHWLHVIDFFRDVPKDSCILQVDDDDAIQVSKAIGDHQIIAAGPKLSQLILDRKEACIESAKRVIDECAGTGGFLFCTDKDWLCTNDINQNLIDVYQFAHEYGRY